MKIFGVFMILLLLLIPAATAATVTITPTRSTPGIRSPWMCRTFLTALPSRSGSAVSST
jgi:hypothetical protein